MMYSSQACLPKRLTCIPQLLDKIQISVVPSLNVDGAFQAEKGSCDVNDGMSNANGVNLDKLFRRL